MAYNLFSTNYNVSSTNNLNTLFGTASTNTLLSDYASIRNGSYSKLLKSYYSSDSKKTSGDDNNATTTASDKINTTTIRNEAKELGEAADVLLNTAKGKNLFEMKEIKAEDGTVTNDYDRDAIYKAVADFADKYNKLIDSADDTENTGILRTTANMVGYMKANTRLLDKSGITIGADNKLTINPDKFNKADMSALKTLFSGSYSVASKVDSSASKIYNQSVSALASMENSLYSQSGKYLYTGSTYNKYL